MAGLFSVVEAAANGIRRQVLTPEQKIERADRRKKLEMVKIASMVSFIASVLLFSLFPGLFTLCLAGLTGLTAREVYKVAKNISEILDNGVIEGITRLSQENLIKQVTKGTYLIGSLVRIVNPDLRKYLFFSY